MDLYTLSDTFLAKDPVDEFVSAIWTERYTSAGDFQLVVPITAENIDKFAEGTFLALRGSDEVMQVETLDISEGNIKVSGTSLVTFLDQRNVWSYNPGDSSPENRISDPGATTKPGLYISFMVLAYAITPVPFGGAYDPANLDWVKESIAGLSLGATDVSGADVRINSALGPLYSSIQPIADQFQVGISLYLESADPIAGYSLKFKTYRGLDRTSGQSARPMVRLTPDMDQISDLKEVRSLSLFKNVVYVYYNGIITKHLLDPTAPEPEGFERRVLVVDPEATPIGHKVTQDGPMYTGIKYTVTVVSPADIAAFRAQVAADAFANHNYIHAIDGQASPISDYEYGRDYGLGDIIELEGLTGAVTKARVTEFIRAEDQTGERNYPTISVIT